MFKALITVLGQFSAKRGTYERVRLNAIHAFLNKITIKQIQFVKQKNVKQLIRPPGSCCL